jgi:large subunit ribosomal protein L10
VDKEAKAALVEEIASDLGSTQTVFAIDYRGISVSQAAELRTKLAEAEASFKVVKNRLAKRAAEQAGAEGLDPLLEGPTALTYVSGDPVIAAKVIAAFSRANDVLAYKGGVMDGEPLDPDSFHAIARLPGLDVLHGQLVGVTASPLTGLVRGLGSLMSGLAVALGQIQEQGLVGGEAESETPAEAESAEEPEAETDSEAAEEQVEETEDAEASEEPAVEADSETEQENKEEQEDGEGND